LNWEDIIKRILITGFVPCVNMEFLYLFQCEEYDIVEIIVRGVNEMYDRRNELIDK
jgi:hypothetical protein